MGINESLDAHQDRLAGGLQGLLIGDAIGVPYEFHKASNLPSSDAINFEPPLSFNRSHKGIAPGTWSDDGAQALCLLQSLMAQDGLNLRDFSRRLVNWADWGHLAVNGNVFDIGIQTARAIEALRSGVEPDHAGPAQESDNGNGALMRVLPLALWHVGTDESLIVMAAQQSLPTHGHPRSAVACAMLCLWAREELEATPSSWEDAEVKLRQLGPEAGLPFDEIERVLSLSNRDKVGGSGYVFDTLWSARVAMEESRDYTNTVRRAIAFGNDTDTTAAVAGGIAGIRYGLCGIPLAWREALLGQNLFKDLQQGLLLHAEGRKKVSEEARRTTETDFVP